MSDPKTSQSKSPDLRGQRVELLAADHPYAGKTGVVVHQIPCALFAGCDCGYQELIVQLDNGVRTNVYEPEAGVVS